MVNPLAPGPRRVRGKLAIAAWIVGGTLCLGAGFMALFPTLMLQLAQDTVVMRALALTLAMGGVMVARASGVIPKGSAHMPRRATALGLVAYLATLGAVLLVYPSAATWMYLQGYSRLAPWILALPGLLLLGLGRWDQTTVKRR